MVVWKYFYVDIDPIGRQMTALRMMELAAKFPQQKLEKTLTKGSWVTLNICKTFGLC
jgi:hypothetical protein